ncbi:MAG: DMT family transporter [Dokdonella sp.]|nr:MAG: DMT family transporter [Dokdonella sp.]
MTPSAAARRPALLALCVLSLIWSYNWIVMKQALAWAGPITFSAWRYGLGTLVLFALLVLRRRPLRPPPLWPTAWIGLAQTTGFQLLVQAALLSGGAGRTALLAYTMPFWVVLMNWLALGQWPTRRLWLGLGVAAGGLLLVLEPWQGPGSDLTPTLLALAGGVCWAVGVVLSKRLFERGGVGALSLTAWQMLFGSVVIIACAVLVPERPVAWTGGFIAALAYNALLSSGLGWAMWSFIVAQLPANVAGLSSLAIPVLGIGFAWLVLGERPSGSESLGIGLIVIALALVNLRRARQP